MKNYRKMFFLTMILFINSQLFAINTKVLITQDSIQSSPENVVNAIFNAANDKNFDALLNLCDPKGDGDIREICGIGYSEETAQEDFCKYFKDGYISGEVIYTDENNAIVPIKFGVGATESEQMKVVKRKENWFLMSF